MEVACRVLGRVPPGFDTHSQRHLPFCVVDTDRIVMEPLHTCINLVRQHFDHAEKLAQQLVQAGLASTTLEGERGVMSSVGLERPMMSWDCDGSWQVILRR